MSQDKRVKTRLTGQVQSPARFTFKLCLLELCILSQHMLLKPDQCLTWINWILLPIPQENPLPLPVNLRKSGATERGVYRAPSHSADKFSLKRGISLLPKVHPR